MKTRLLRKLRREAKRRIKIINPLKEKYNIYYIEKTTIEHGSVKKEWFHYPLYGCFLNSRPFGFRDRAKAIELLPKARRDYILLEFYKLKRNKLRNILLKEKLKERIYLNNL